MTNNFDPANVHKSLDALRAKHGADSPIGHRCSNLIEQWKNREAATPELRKDLDKFIAQSVADLTRLSTQNAEERG